MSEMETLRDPAILLRVAGYIEALFARSLGVSGYDVIDGMRPLNEGEARFVNGHIDVYFRKAVYPHNIFVRWSDGSSGAVIYPGKSGRSGTSLPAAQRIHAEPPSSDRRCAAGQWRGRSAQLSWSAAGPVQ